MSDSIKHQANQVPHTFIQRRSKRNMAAWKSGVIGSVQRHWPCVWATIGETYRV